jgi:hypothetical protein
MEALKQGSDALFILLGGIMVLAMHAGFAFLELGTVRKKNQVNALVKILVDFSVSTVVYFLVGYGVAYGTSFLVGAEQLAARNGYDLVKFFFLLTFAAAIPAIISGGIAERAKFWPQIVATAVIVGWSTRSSKASPGTSSGASRLGSRQAPATSSTILRARWWSMPWAAGWHCLRCCCWAPAPTGTARMARSARIRHRTFRFWRWAPGS